MCGGAGELSLFRDYFRATCNIVLKSHERARVYWHESELKIQEVVTTCVD